mgnify:CR=1 FL=1
MPILNSEFVGEEKEEEEKEMADIQDPEVSQMKSPRAKLLLMFKGDNTDITQ